jgi:hypothetical protein
MGRAREMDSGLLTLMIVIVAALALYVYFHYWHHILDGATSP